VAQQEYIFLYIVRVMIYDIDSEILMPNAIEPCHSLLDDFNNVSMANELDKPYMDCLSLVHQERYDDRVSLASLIYKFVCDIDTQYTNLLDKLDSIDDGRQSIVLSSHYILDLSNNEE
jgi:hypothetical protein